MSRTTISLCKFVGTVSLGLLTGVSYTLTTHLLPTLLSLPNATLAHQSYTALRTTAERHLRSLSAVSISALTLAFALAPRRGRHPYLLWTGLTVALGGGVDWFLRSRDGGGLSEGFVDVEGDDEEVNGEGVKREVERWRAVQGLRAGVSALGFGMAVLGIWGDGV